MQKAQVMLFQPRRANHEGHEENKAVVNSLYAAFVIFVVR
jgi:hypothetical protein